MADAPQLGASGSVLQLSAAPCQTWRDLYLAVLGHVEQRLASPSSSFSTPADDRPSLHLYLSAPVSGPPFVPLPEQRLVDLVDCFGFPVSTLSCSSNQTLVAAAKDSNSGTVAAASDASAPAQSGLEAQQAPRCLGELIVSYALRPAFG